MPFFLLARDEDDQLRLLTSAISASRQDALAALAKLTEDPGFDAWDAEVLLVDVDSALPVLLVRPSEHVSEVDPRVPAVAPEEPEVAEAEPAGDVTFMWPAADHVTAHPEPEAFAPPATEIPTEEAEAFASYVSLAEDDTPVEPETDELLAEEDASGVAVELPVPAFAHELEDEQQSGQAEVEPGPSLEDAADEPGAGSALVGVGVVAVDFVAGALGAELDEEPVSQPEAEVEMPAEPQTDSEIEPEIEPEPEPELEPDPEPETAPETLRDDSGAQPTSASEVPLYVQDQQAAGEVEANELRDALARTTAAMELETASEKASDIEVLPIPAEEPPIDRWPWEAAAPTVAAVAVPLGATVIVEDDTVVEESLGEPEVPSLGDPSTEDEPADAPPNASTFLDDLEPLPTVSGSAVSEAQPEAEIAGAVDDPTPSGAAVGDAISESVPEAPAAEERVSMDSYVCDDCVYVGTCPNKDQRLPKDCGSFQWK